MSNNEQIIRDVTALTQQFESQKDAERLRQAYQKLEGVKLYAETNPARRQNLRRVVSGLWIKILNLVDDNLSPDFDPEKTIQIQTPTFTGKDGTEYPPGTEPQAITNPDDRAAYIKAAADHKKAQQSYRLQMHLYRLNEQLSESARNYFILAYGANDPDRREFRTLLETTVKSKIRRDELMKFVR